MFDKKSRGYKIFFWITLILLGMFIFFPLYWMLVTSLKTREEIFVFTLFPSQPTIENYINVIQDPVIMRYFLNSLFVSFVCSIVSTVVSTLTAYSISKFRYRGRKALLSFILLSRVFPQVVLLLTIYTMMRTFKLTGNYLSLILSFVTFTLPVGTWTLKSYIDQLPDSIIESAKIDGASNMRIMRSILLPLIVPGLISTAIYGFVWAWNDILYSLTLVTSSEMRMLSSGLILRYTGEFQNNWGGMMAASVIVSIPVTLIFIFLQRYFIAGMMSGAVKG